jgi:hypothetical protein
MEQNNSTPAFPISKNVADSIPLEQRNGLTKREYFAAMVMQGIIANPTTINATEKGAEFVDMIAKTSIKIADELLKQLSQ